MHQAEQLGVGADQDVLAVVELIAFPVGRDAYPARSPAGDLAGFKDGDWNTGLREGDRGSHAGITSANDGYALTHVFQASQNLRSGVREVRCVRTWNPSRSISVSSVR